MKPKCMFTKFDWTGILKRLARFFYLKTTNVQDTRDQCPMPINAYQNQSVDQNSGIDQQT